MLHALLDSYYLVQYAALYLLSQKKKKNFLFASEFEANSSARLVPPLGVFMISGCSVDLLINILLTILGLVTSHHTPSCPCRGS